MNTFLATWYGGPFDGASLRIDEHQYRDGKIRVKVTESGADKEYDVPVVRKKDGNRLPWGERMAVQ